MTVKDYQIKPLGSRVLVRPLTREEKTRGGIILPETAKERPEEGEVLAVGPGERNDRGERVLLDVKVGDQIVFTKYGPNELKIEDEELLIVSEKDILAIVKLD